MKAPNNQNALARFTTPLHRILFAGVVALVTLLSANVFATGTNYVSVTSGLLSVAANWTPAGVPGAGDTVEITSGILITNSTSSLILNAITVDVGGTFKINAATTAGAVTNKGTFWIGIGTSPRTLAVTTNLVNNGILMGDTSQLNVLNFNGSAVAETWTGSGDISGGKINLTVGATTTLDITGLTNNLTIKTTGTLSPTVSGKLIAGTNVITANNTGCTFTIAAGATLVSANTNGLINGSVGTFNVTGPVVLNTNASYTFNGSTAQVTTGLPGVVTNLTINGGSSVTLSASTIINGSLTLTSGPLITSSGAFPTLTNTSSITGSSYVSGPLAVTFNAPGAQTFPVGKGGNPRSVTVSYTALTGPSIVTVEQFESAMGGTLPSGTSEFSSRYWALSQTGGSGFSYNLSLDGTGYSPAATPVILQQGTPDASYTATFASPNYTATGLTSFTNVSLGSYAPAADMIAFITSPATLTSDTASGTITVQLQNSGGSPKTYSTNLTVNLSTTSGTGSFRDTGDTTTITSVTIAAGNSSASFKYRDTTAPASPTLTASANSVSPATQVETVNTGSANKLAFTTQPVNSLLGTTMASIVVQVEDDHGNNVAQSGTAISLTLNGASFGSGITTIVTDGTGKATYSDLVINVVAANLTITANASGLAAATSSSFNVTSHQIVKAGNTLDMGSTSSWVGGVIPSTNDTAVINSTSVLASPSNFSDLGLNPQSWYGLLVTNWAAGGGYTINDSSGTLLTLGAGGLLGTNVPHTTIMNMNTLLAVPQTWSWNATLALNFNGAVDNGGNLLTMGGTGPMNMAGVITGAGGLTKIGTDTVTFSNANTYTGSTVISNGTLNVSVAGSTTAASTVTVTSGGNLAGAGTIGGAVTVQSGGAFTPGAGLATLTLSGNLNLQAGSSTSVQVSQTANASSQVTVASNVVYGGTLVVTNLAGTLTVGNQFTLFTAAGESGNFSSISGSPGAGLNWNFSPASGILSVVSGTATNQTNIVATFSGNSLSITWPGDHLGWILQGETNALNVGLTTNWVDVPGSASVTNENFTINPTNGSVFFRLRSP